MQKFCIYGAGIVASSIYTAIKDAYNCTPVFFVVSDKNGNPDTIDGIPVITFQEWDISDGRMVYLIAAPELYHHAIWQSLNSKGISDNHIIAIDNSMENWIMGVFYSQQSIFTTVQEILNIRKPYIEVFQAKSHKDRMVSVEYKIPHYVQSIQVGAALTDKVFLDKCDNKGDNISAKNGNYCELTATYYAWKHSTADYKGLCHYCRIFDINDEQMQELMNRRTEWDAVLPYPSIHYPNILCQHQRYVKEKDWDAMLCALKETAPEYYDEFHHVFQRQFFYNYNMIIARSEVFDDYCSFIFSVLARTEELTSPKGWERSDRFAGYLGENLTTLYFMANKDRLKIIHAGKRWLM